jgi:hypothetical protein
MPSPVPILLRRCGMREVEILIIPFARPMLRRNAQTSYPQVYGFAISRSISSTVLGTPAVRIS